MDRELTFLTEKPTPALCTEYLAERETKRNSQGRAAQDTRASEPPFRPITGGGKRRKDRQTQKKTPSLAYSTPGKWASRPMDTSVLPVAEPNKNRLHPTFTDRCPDARLSQHNALLAYSSICTDSRGPRCLRDTWELGCNNPRTLWIQPRAPGYTGSSPRLPRPEVAGQCLPAPPHWPLLITPPPRGPMNGRVVSSKMH